MTARTLDNQQESLTNMALEVKTLIEHVRKSSPFFLGLFTNCCLHFKMKKSEAPIGIRHVSPWQAAHGETTRALGLLYKAIRTEKWRLLISENENTIYLP
jgi:hypothetical protein